MLRSLVPFRTLAAWSALVIATAATPACGAASRDAGPARGGAQRIAPANEAQAQAPLQAHLIGRFDRSDPAGPRFTWPGSAIVARFRGTGLDVRLRDSGTSYFTVVVDGGAPTVLATRAAQERYSLARALTQGVHVVEMYKRTETLFGEVQILGLDALPEGDGALLPDEAPAHPPRRIELIGDSITCGYGATGSSATCKFTADTEDEYDAYGARAARLLGAEHTAIAWSGKGITQNYGGGREERMPELWERTLADRPASRWGFAAPPPDVVVVNLGSNDFWNGDPGAPFGAAYAALVANVRARYPSALIVCALGPMLDPPRLDAARRYIQGAVAEARARSPGDERISFLEFPMQTAADGYGCDYHPSLRTHARMAEQLAAHLRTLTGW